MTRETSKHLTFLSKTYPIGVLEDMQSKKSVYVFLHVAVTPPPPQS